MNATGEHPGRKKCNRREALQLENSTRENILIVDDEEINRMVLANIFDSEYGIIEAEDGEAGMAAALEHQDSICAVLLDVMMPKIDGIEMLREFQKRGMTDSIPVFLITADAADSTMREAYDLGVMDFILKPVVPYVVRRPGLIRSRAFPCQTPAGSRSGTAEGSAADSDAADGGYEYGNG